MYFWVRAEFARPLTQGVDKFVVGELFDNQSKTPGGIIVANDDRVGGNHARMAAMRPRRGAKAYPSPLERFPLKMQRRTLVGLWPQGADDCGRDHSLQ